MVLCTERLALALAPVHQPRAHTQHHTQTLSLCTSTAPAFCTSADRLPTLDEHSTTLSCSDLELSTNRTSAPPTSRISTSTLDERSAELSAQEMEMAEGDSTP